MRRKGHKNLLLFIAHLRVILLLPWAEFLSYILLIQDVAVIIFREFTIFRPLYRCYGWNRRRRRMVIKMYGTCNLVKVKYIYTSFLYTFAGEGISLIKKQKITTWMIKFRQILVFSGHVYSEHHRRNLLINNLLTYIPHPTIKNNVTRRKSKNNNIINFLSTIQPLAPSRQQ